MAAIHDAFVFLFCSLDLLQLKAPEADSEIARKRFPSQTAEIGRLDEHIKGGTTVVAALIYDSKLYVANIGDSRALLCSQVKGRLFLAWSGYCSVHGSKGMFIFSMVRALLCSWVKGRLFLAWSICCFFKVQYSGLPSIGHVCPD